MPSEHTTISASDGGAIPTYISAPDGGKGIGIVMIASIFGVAEDIQEYADKLAAEGYVAAAPDPFWRDEDPGVMPAGEEGRPRAFARMGRVDHEVSIGDLGTVIEAVKAHPNCNGTVAVMGFCFGGQYALWGASRHGAAAGIAYHSGKISHLLDELDNVSCPLSWHWGDDDAAAPQEELDTVGAAFADRDNSEMFIYPDGKHGFTQWTNPPAYSEDIRDKAWSRSLELLKSL